MRDGKRALRFTNSGNPAPKKCPKEDVGEDIAPLPPCRADQSKDDDKSEGSNDEGDTPTEVIDKLLQTIVDPDNVFGDIPH